MNETAGADTGPLGIFGGTFDPVHNGHLQLAQAAMDALALAQISWMPAGQPPLREIPQTPATHRLAMVRLAVAGHPGFCVDSHEADAPRASYTVHSLDRLRQSQGPKRPLVLLLGADAFARLDAWRDWRRLFELAHIGVTTRAGYALKVGAGDTALDREFAARHGEPGDLATRPAGRIVPFVMPDCAISATAIRHALAGGERPRFMVPCAVLDYIEDHQLYRA